VVISTPSFDAAKIPRRNLGRVSKFVHPPYINGMAKNKLRRWEVYRLKGASGAFVGSVHASDERGAVKEAIKQFEVKNPDHQKRLYARPAE